MHVRLKDGMTVAKVHESMAAAGWPDMAALDRLVEGIAAGTVETGADGPVPHDALAALARYGCVVFVDGRAGEATAVVPCRWNFDTRARPAVGDGPYKMARLAYVHAEDGAVCLRHPASDCFVRSRDPAAMAVLGRFHGPAEVDAGTAAMAALLVRAGVLQPCDGDGRTMDEARPERRHWELHDAIFHARSRVGRTEQLVGATWRFKGELDQAPAVKANPWTGQVIPLPGADLMALTQADVPLTAAVEARRSVRHNSIVPLTALELGAFLYRTVRIRTRYTTPDGEFTSRPYPGGGALYESEIYVTIDRCVDLPRGFYYYDAERHALCLIAPPDANTEGLLEEARMATAGVCRPQILLTIAGRHPRFSWKYSGMAYAAQLKNVGVIYQTMYLVATAMNLGGCALGLGNTDRFLALTGLD